MYEVNNKAREKRKQFYVKKYKQQQKEENNLNEDYFKKTNYGRRGMLQMVSDSESDNSEDEDFLDKKEKNEEIKHTNNSSFHSSNSSSNSHHQLNTSPFLTRKIRTTNNLTYNSKQDKATSKQKKLKSWKLVLEHWNDSDFELNTSIHQIVAELIPLGIPSSIRAKVWCALSSADDLMQKNRGVYQSLLEFNDIHKFDPYIGDDIPRTLPKHPLFNGPSSEGQRELTNILKAYSVFNPAVGYCQGMNFIAGSLYLTFRNAEIVFWAFVNILQKVKCLFSEGVPLLNLSLDIFEKLLHAQLPLVSAHLARQKVTLAPFAAQWFSTLFCFAEIPQKLSCRILDIFLYSGYEIIFRVGLAILKIGSPALMKLKGEDIVIFARSPPESYLQPSNIINIALSFEIDEEITKQIYEATN